MIWLGHTRGQLTDWVTQRWVQLTGRRVDLARDPWLAGPVGQTAKVGKEFFAELARREGLEDGVGPRAGGKPQRALRRRLLHSTGRGFGDPGFYFTVHGANGLVWARYLAAMKEAIHVHAAPDGVRADHTLTLCGATFLRLHYRLRRTAGLVSGVSG